MGGGVGMCMYTHEEDLPGITKISKQIDILTGKAAHI